MRVDNLTIMDRMTEIVRLIESRKINTTTEANIQRDVANLLREAGFHPDEEVQLDAASRIDIMVGSIGLELKARAPRRKVYSQLERYTASPLLKGLVLVTGSTWPPMHEIQGVPFMRASLARAWL